MKKILFIGSHLGHSLLPAVYDLIAEQIKIDIQVVNAEVELDEFKKLISKEVLSEYLLACVTFPYKLIAGTLVNTKTKRAEASQSVNIVYWDKENGIVGDNTDGKGFYNDLEKRLKVNVRDKEILILGSGGVSSGIIPELYNNQSKKIVVCSRNEQSPFPSHTSVTVCSYQTIPKHDYELVINATSASIYNELPPLLIEEQIKNAFFYECAYQKNYQTTFQQFLHHNQIFKYSSGIGMLIEQAAVAIEHILNVEVNTISIFNQLIQGIEQPLKIYDVNRSFA